MTATTSLSRPVSTPRRRSRETARRMHLPPAKRSGPENAYAFVHDLLGDDVHATRVLSLANGVVGVMHSAALGIHAIGRGLADALDLDRLLSNRGIEIWAWFTQWVLFRHSHRLEKHSGIESVPHVPSLPVQIVALRAPEHATPVHSTSRSDRPLQFSGQSRATGGEVSRQGG